MRGHKYKIWDKLENRMIMPCDIPFEIDCNMGEFLEIILEGHSDRYVSLQWTGLLDKSKKEIYEGDIVNYAMGEFDRNLIVKWDGGGCKYVCGEKDDGWNGYSLQSNYEIKIIGDIYKNPELLKETK